MKLKARYKDIKKHLLKHKKIYLAALILIIIISAVFGTKLILYINFLLGNDIILKLGSDKTTTTLTRGQSDTATYEASFKANPFCKVQCRSSYSDMSSNSVIENDSFILKSIAPLVKKYNVTAERLGSGLEIYRFDLDCHAVKSFLCHTEEEQVTRSLLFTLQYHLSEEDEMKKEGLHSLLEQESENLGIMRIEENTMKNTASSLSSLLIIDDITECLGRTESLIDKHQIGFMELLRLWESQDLEMLEKETNDFILETELINKNLTSMENQIDYTITAYNGIGESLANAGKELENITRAVFSDWDQALVLANIIIQYNRQVLLQDIQETLEKKEEDISGLVSKIYDVRMNIEYNIMSESLRKDIEADIFYDLLCRVSGTCIEHPDINERAFQTQFSLDMSCSRIEELHQFYAEIKQDMETAAMNQSYPQKREFSRNVSRIVSGLRNREIQEAMDSLEEGPNSDMIREILVEEEVKKTSGYPQINLTPALVLAMEERLPERCDIVSIRFDKVKEFEFTQIRPNVTEDIENDIIIDEPMPECPVFGTDFDCCTDVESVNNLYPVLFLHGHAVNKDLSAEYSLEGFNQIQKELEKDGYLNSGSITLNTPGTTDDGWTLIPVPMVFRGSYYFDIFGEPENYVTVQGKSENIDTYAIRLKELVDTVLKKTGREKVRIVAFSMGGLVSRRYIQIFGDDYVDRLIMIGTPNNGIVGEIADLCPLIGEDLECRDMNSESLFMNKLNHGGLPDIPIYNIVGTGCQMSGGMGDGAVLEEKALLEGAKNFIIRGECESKFSPLHLDLRDIDKYPQVYEILVDALEEQR